MTYSANNIIGGSTPGSRNVISGNSRNVLIRGDGNVVQGNFVGTNASGTTALSNTGEGVFVADARNNLIGGTSPGAGNVISGNQVNGITVYSGTAGTVIAGNRIGTDAAGTTALGNTGDGIGVYYGASDTTISENVVAASSYNGIRLNNVTRNIIQHNWVGTNGALAAGLGNAHQGISVAASSNTTIGGSAGFGNVVAGNGQGGIGIESAATATQILGNVVSGNTGNGIGVLDSQNATLSGNKVGTNLTGSASWANSGAGISVSGATTTGITIGGVAPGAGNLVVRQHVQRPGPS